MNRLIPLLLPVVVAVVGIDRAAGFSVSLDGSGYAARWDAASRFVGGDDRSLVGGLSWAVTGGDLATYYDEFTFLDGVTLEGFTGIVEDAFDAWVSYDKGTGSVAAFTFVMSDRDAEGDFFFGGDLDLGAEIDLLSGHLGFGGGFTYRKVSAPGAAGIELTSGVTGHGGGAITGADVFMNVDREWTGDEFRLVLTHELGIALGLVDVDYAPNFGSLPAFFDDNYDPAFATETLTNAWSGSIDVYNPEGTAVINTYSVNNGVPGFDSPGADLLMETQLPVAFLGLNNPLSADEYAGRQFLYPVVSVPEPGPLVLVVLAALVSVWRRSR